jgi:DHA1 family bicyclomycin/chloramphenicol resistance-like MFS transporter
MKDGPGTSDNDWFARPGFIAFIAALMGVLSLAIEICLPAMRYIADDFGLANPNAAQSVVTVFILAFGMGHLFQGFLADRFGRKPVLLVNLGIYAAAGAACAVTDSFELLLAARAVQGVAAAGSRVVGTAILRDVKDGSDLARSMSLAMMVFSGIPVLAPFIGQAAILAFGYRSVFVLLFLAPAMLFAVALLRLPETWPSERRIPIRPAAVLRSLRWLWGSRDTLGYTAIAGILYGQLFGYIASAPQVFAEVFGVTTLFPVYLSLVALGIGLAAFLNSRIVRAVGTRRVVFFALCGVLLASAGLCLVAYAYGLDLAIFQTFFMLVMFGNGMAFANCNVLAIQPHGQIAGVASSIVGGATMIISAVLSHLIGQAFDGTAIPLATSLFGLALLALTIERLTSRCGRSASPTRIE